jgi:hypothetical protein
VGEVVAALIVQLDLMSVHGLGHGLKLRPTIFGEYIVACRGGRR